MLSVVSYLDYTHEPFAVPVLQESDSAHPPSFSLLSLPTSYDLRSLGDVTPPKNQGGCGSCWTFATYGALESSILKDGGPARDLSENHLKNEHGFDRAPCSGGNINMSQAYLSRWSGPVDESADPYFPGDDRPSPNATPQYYVRESHVFDTDDEIKFALMEHGGLYTSMWWEDGSYNSPNDTYYYSGTGGSNHGVTIVGWDDTQPTDATTPGAWLIKNSWGTSWGNGGFFWISYEDTVGANSAVSFHDAVNPDSFSHVYFHDEFGQVGVINTPYALNRFTATANEDLAAIQFWTQADGARYELRIYDDFFAGILANQLAATSGVLEFGGMHTVDLPESVALTAGDRFYVYLHITNGGDYPQAYDFAKSNYSSNSTANPGESFYSHDGEDWTALTTWKSTANFAIKALVGSRNPVVDLNGIDDGRNDSASVIQHEGATVIVGSDATVFDPDSSHLTSLTARITNLKDGDAEVLSANTAGTNITRVYSNGVLTLSGTDTVANYQKVLRTISYYNSARDPDLTARIIRFVASDGQYSSNTATSTVAVQVIRYTGLNTVLPDVEQSSLAWADYDRDGDLDLLLTGLDANSNALTDIYRNENGEFHPINAGMAPVHDGSASWGDYDHDGYLDVLLTGGSVPHTQLYRQNEGGAFTPVAAGLTDVSQSAAAWGDYDNDGDLDIVLIGSDAGSHPVAHLYQNSGGSFTEDVSVSLTPVDRGSVSWGDYDRDGRLDILLTGYGASGPVTKVYHNEGGSFQETPTTLPDVFDGSAAWGDYDNDGDLDILLTGTSSTTRITDVYENDAGTFTLLSTPLPSVSQGSAAWGDFDNDGDLDIVLSGRKSSGEVISDVFRNSDGLFEHVDTALVGVYHSSSAWGDYDNDGDLDIVAAGRTDSGDVLTNLYRNNVQVANTTPSQPSALKATLESLTSATLQWNPSYDQETPLDGLVYNLRVGTTPGGSEIMSAAASHLGNVGHNTSWTLEGLTPGQTYYWSVQAIDTGFATSSFAIEQVFTTSFLPDSSVNLIGVNLSSADCGDYDDDGNLDILLIGDTPSGPVTKVYHNVGGTFQDIAAGLPGVKQGSVAWGDYDNDDDLDVLLAGETGTGPIASVYQNNGGTFQDVGAALTGVYQSSVAWGDYDNDGDLDILATGKNASGEHTAAVYQNQEGAFSQDAGIELTGVAQGAAVWGDYDNDGWLDILLTGQSASGAVTRLYHNQEGGFQEAFIWLPEMSQSSAAWGDYDNDGDLDILLTGNYLGVSGYTIVCRNMGGGFQFDTSPSAVTSGSSAWGDYDNDGDLDILVNGLDSSFIPRTHLYRNDSGNFSKVDTGLTDVSFGSAAWADYDNDGDLDILLAGSDATYTQIAGVYRNETTTANTPPTAPTGLTATVESSSSVILSWDPAGDADTPVSGLTYNLRVGNTPAGSDVLGPMADLADGQRRVARMGSVGHNTEWTPNGLTWGQTYYWSVQAIDSAFAGSSFGAEGSFLVNQAPTDIFPSSSSVDENEPIGTVVGTLATVDGDNSAGDSHTYALVAGEGDDDNVLFAIDGETLKTAAVFDHEAKETYGIRMRSTDAYGYSFEKAIAVTIADVNEFPTAIDLSKTTVAENAPSAEIGTFRSEDPDTDQTHTYTILSDPSGVFELSGVSGEILGLRFGESADFETQNAYWVTIQTTDSGTPALSRVEAFRIDVVDIEEQTAALVKDVNAYGHASSPDYLTELDGKLYFAAAGDFDEMYARPSNRELWCVDPTTNTTSLVKDLLPGSGKSESSNPRYLTAFNGELFFSANDGSSSSMVFKYNPDTDSVSSVEKNFEGDAISYPQSFAVFNGELFFSARHDDNRSKLWKYHPADGLAIVGDSSYGFSPNYLTVYNDALYFSAYDGGTRRELWKYHPDTGTTLAPNIRSGPGRTLYPSVLTVYDGCLYFRDYDDLGDLLLWKYHPDVGAEPVASERVGNVGGHLSILNGELFFAGAEKPFVGVGNRELWKYHPDSGVVQVAEIAPGDRASQPGHLTVFAGGLYFSANDGSRGRELWKYDPSLGTTSQVADINPRQDSSNPSSLLVFDGELYFAADDGVRGEELNKVVSKPFARGDETTTNEDTSVSITVLANDVDPNEQPLTLHSFSEPSHGSLTDNGDGTVTYTPNPDYYGQDSFEYTITDGRGGFDTATVTIAIESVNDQPSFTASAPAAVEEDALAAYVHVAGFTDDVLAAGGTGGRDAFVAQFAPDMTWVDQFAGVGPPAYDTASAVDADGYVYVAGRTQGVLGTRTWGGSDAYLRKYDAFGNLLWTEQFGSEDTEYVYGTSVDGNGNVYVIGTTNGDLGAGSFGGMDAYVRKYDPSGSHLWTEQFGTVNGDYAFGISVDDSGGVYVAGRTAGDLGATNSGGWDAYVRKYDASGAHLWTQQFGTANSDDARAVSIGGAGNVYLAGSVSNSSGVWDGFVRKYDASGNLLWDRLVETSSHDHAYGVSADADGNVYVAGDTGGVMGIARYGSSDAYVRKYDALGNVLWTEQFGTSYGDVANGVSVDSSGNVHVAGDTWDTDSGWDAYVRTYDASGAHLWTDRFSFEDETQSNGVSADADGNVYVVGYTKDPEVGGDDAYLRKYDASGSHLWTDRFGSRDTTSNRVNAVASDETAVYVAGSTDGVGEGSAGRSDVHVRKYDLSGNLSWSAQFGSASGEAANGIAVDQSGNVYVGGYTNGDLEGENAGSMDAFVTKLDASGALLWTRQFGTSSYDRIYDVSVDVGGNVYLAGGTGGVLGASSSGYTDAFVRKYDAEGNHLWTEQFGSPGSEAAQGIALDDSGNLYLAGYTSDVLGAADLGDYDAYVRKLDPSGGHLWTRQFGTSGEDWAESIAVDGDGNAYVVGYVEGLLGASTSGSYDAYVRKYDTSGDVLWTDQFFSPYGGAAAAVSLDGAGGVYVVGSVYGVLGAAAIGEADAYLRKYDVSGNHFGTEQFGSPGRDSAAGVAAHSSQARTIARWATFDAGPNEPGQAVAAYTVSNVSNPALFSELPSVAPDGTLSYTPAPDANGTSTFDLSVQDGGGTAHGGVDMSASQTFTITVTAVNDGPAVTSPPDVHSETAADIAIAGLSVDDPDVAETPGAEVEVTLSVGDGKLVLSQLSGLTFASGGNNTSSMAVRGVLPDVNAALATLVYQSDVDFYGADTLEVEINDLGNTGSGGAKTAGATTTIRVLPRVLIPTGETTINVARSGDDLVVTDDSATEFFRGALDTFSGVVIVGAEDSETFQVNTDGLTPGVLPLGLTLETGENGALDNDVLALIGSATNVEYAFDPMDAEAGTVTVDGLVIAFSELETTTIYDNIDAENRTFTFPGAVSQTIILSDDDDPYNGLSMISDGDTGTFVTVVYRPAQVATTVEAGEEADSITVGVLDRRSTELIVVEGQGGPDHIDASASESDVTMVGGPGDDFMLGGKGPNTFIGGGGNNEAIAGEGPNSFTSEVGRQTPEVFTDAYEIEEDVALTVEATLGVLANDVNPSGDGLLAVLIEGTTHGALDFNTDGRFVYTPDPDFFGPDRFSYRATNAHGQSSVATVRIEVTAVNDVPVAGDDLFLAQEDVALVVAAPGVLSNDDDVEGPLVSVQIVASPAHGAATLDDDGSFTYVPQENSYGLDFFTYRVTDEEGASDTARVSILVNPVNDAPEAVVVISGVLDEGSPVDFDGSGSTDADGDALSYTWGFGDGGAGTDPALTHTYADDGDYAVSLTVVDGPGATDRHSLTLSVNNVAPSFDAGGPETLPPEVMGVFVREDILVTDPGADTWTGTVDYDDGTVEDLTVDAAMTFDLGHTYEVGGVYTVTVTIADGDGGVCVDTFELTVIRSIIEFSAAVYTDVEGAGASQVVVLNRNTDVGQSEVLVSVTGGSATGGFDYTGSAFPVIFAVGETSKKVEILLTQDNIVELDETIDLVVTSVTNTLIGTQDTATLTIRNDDSAEFTIKSVSGSEDAGSLTFEVTLSNPVDVATSVDVSTGDDTALVADNDYGAVSQTLSFPAGVTSQPFEVLPTADIKVEPHEAFTVSMSNVVNGDRNVTASSTTGTGTIVNDDVLKGRVFDDRDNDGLYDASDGDEGIGGVAVQLLDQQSNALIDTQTTDDDGVYTFNVTLQAGTYKIVEAFDEPNTTEVENELTELGMLDGKETPGVNGGTVDNTQNSNAIADIGVGGVGAAAGAVDYLFAELLPASLQGLVWEDFDNHGDVDLTEIAIDGATVRLTGADDRGHAVDLTQTTDSQGMFEFIDLRPGAYAITETQPTSVGGVPTDFVDGQEVLGEVVEREPPTPAVVLGVDGVVDPVEGDKFSGIVLAAGSQGVNYNFGERVDGGQLSTGQTATIGFWQNKNGQALIKSLNGSESSTLLAGWLADTFPNMYGTYFTAGVDDNADVAGTYKLLFKRNGKTSPGGPPKVDAQVMAVAMATYLTKESLVSLSYNPAGPANPTTDASLIAGVESYGFDVTIGGLGSTFFNVGDSGLAFGVADNSRMQIIDLLLATDRMSLAGLLYDDADEDDTGDGEIDDFETLLRTLANDVYTAINEQGRI